MNKILPGDWVVISYNGKQYEANVLTVFSSGVPASVRIQNDPHLQGEQIPFGQYQIMQVLKAEESEP